MDFTERIQSSRLLFVEGVDEEKLFGALLKHMGLTGLQVMGIAGKTQIAPNLKSFAASSAFTTGFVSAIGVVRDCDNNRKGTFDSVCGALKAAKLPVPTSSMTLIAENDLRVGIMIMPPTQLGTDHMLEDLCLASVGEDRAVGCLENYFACLSQQGITHKSNAIAKARLHAFLASRQEPDLRLGEAAQKGYWNFEHPAFTDVRTFLTQLASA